MSNVENEVLGRAAVVCSMLPEEGQVYLQRQANLQTGHACRVSQLDHDKTVDFDLVPASERTCSQSTHADLGRRAKRCTSLVSQSHEDIVALLRLI